MKPADEELGVLDMAFCQVRELSSGTSPGKEVVTVGVVDVAVLVFSWLSLS